MGRSRAAAKQAGSRMERVTADYLAATVDDRIDRRVTTGAEDKGDIGGIRLPDGRRFVVECKDVVKQDIGGWVREMETERTNDKAAAGAVVHKRRGVADPSRQYVTMTLRDLATLLGGDPSQAETQEKP